MSKAMKMCAVAAEMIIGEILWEVQQQKEFLMILNKCKHSFPLFKDPKIPLLTLKILFKQTAVQTLIFFF